MTNIVLRRAVSEDISLIFEWRNDPFIVAHGSSQRPVTWEEHAYWFTQTLQRDDRIIFLILVHDLPIGQVRFDSISQEACVISIYVLEASIGKGYGTRAIRVGCQKIFQLWDVQTVISCVRMDNPMGRAAFSKAGFIADRRFDDQCPEAHITLSCARNEESSDEYGSP